MAAPSADMSPELIASLEYQKANIDDDRRGMIIGVTWALWILAVVAVGLRFYAERMIRNKFGYHDGLMVLGMIFTTGMCIDITIATRFGGGRHIILADAADLVGTAKVLFAFEWLYTFSIVTIKASILVFYYRTFPHRVFRIAVWIVGAIVGCWLIAMIFLTVFQCIPVSYVWNKNQPGSCMNIARSYVSAAIANVVTDFIIVAMPVPLILRLKLPTRRKLGVCGIFILSSVVLVASIIRPVTLQDLDTNDITYEGIEMGIWTIVEPCLGIVSACLPLMTPLFRRIKEKTIRKSSDCSDPSDCSPNRAKNEQTLALQQPWQKHMLETQVAYDKAVLNGDAEKAEQSSENDSAVQFKYDVEMQGQPKAVRS